MILNYSEFQLLNEILTINDDWINKNDVMDNYFSDKCSKKFHCPYIIHIKNEDILFQVFLFLEKNERGNYTFKVDFAPFMRKPDYLLNKGVPFSTFSKVITCCKYFFNDINNYIIDEIIFGVLEKELGVEYSDEELDRLENDNKKRVNVYIKIINKITEFTNISGVDITINKNKLYNIQGFDFLITDINVRLDKEYNSKEIFNNHTK